MWVLRIIRIIKLMDTYILISSQNIFFFSFNYIIFICLCINTFSLKLMVYVKNFNTKNL